MNTLLFALLAVPLSVLKKRWSFSKLS